MENFLKTAKSSSSNRMADNSAQSYDMIVFCHLRWQFVYQRPQHIISRMAKDMKVLFIEEPIGFGEGEENTANWLVINEQLHVMQPKVNSIASIEKLFPKYIKNKHIPIGWFYSAAFSPLLQSLDFETVIYDCMDELALFKGAPQQLIDQEKFLVANADIVFTGGKSLYESKSGMHPNVYCFPSSVDEAHFAGTVGDIEVPQDIANIPAPIVGYYGVIDERIDLQMLQQTATEMPGVSFVMIGPLAKIDEADLPKEKNIYYLGMKTYDQLPAYLKSFDVAMMPFALNDATKYISPTKTLEYMAAGKPIISTRITDVVRDYSSCVTFAGDAAEFTAAVFSMLLKKDELPTSTQYDEILKKTSWDTTADTMKMLIKKHTK